MADIIGFFGPHRYLSNFWIEPDGTHVEGEFQMRKCALASDRAKFVPGLSPRSCKALGRRVKLREDWESVKIPIMRGLVLRKFGDHPTLNRMLAETGDGYLCEENTWGDRYWGTVDGVGKNYLGIILMQVRLELIPF